MDIAANLSEVWDKIRVAAVRAGRDHRAITIVAVTKTVPVARIVDAVDIGLDHLGENRAQELIAKKDDLPGHVRWHYIGHLQTNKVKDVVASVHMIHSLDRWTLATEIQRRAANRGRQVPVLVQLNVSGELTKQGLALSEAADFVQEVARLTALKVCGLMTIAPLVGHAEEVRPVFRELRLTAKSIHKMHIPGVEMNLLSMGMSNDYQVAVEEGANILRLGTVLFGARV